MFNVQCFLMSNAQQCRRAAALLQPLLSHACLKTQAAAGAAAGACTPTIVLRADCRRDTKASKAPAVSASCDRSAATSALSPADSASSDEGAGAGAAYWKWKGRGFGVHCL